MKECEICDSGRNIAMTVNEGTFCYDCLEFFQHTCKVHGTTPQQEVEHQTAYIKANR